MDFINGQYRTLKLLKEDKHGSEYLVQDLYKDNMAKKMRVIESTPETKDFIDYMKVNHNDYQNLIYPNIAEFYAFNRIREIDARHVVSNKYYYTTEYYEGENLFTYTQGKGFDELLDIAGQICAAFKYVHLRGMLFCNIDADKIHVLETPYGSQVKISSFAYKAPVKDSMLIDAESLYFKAPEVIQHLEYTKKSDIYLLGVILFHIFTGKAAEGSSFKDIIESLQYERESKLGSMIAIIKKCTSINSTDRYKSVDEVVYDMNTIFNKSLKIINKEYIEVFPLYSTTLAGRENYIKHITNKIHRCFYENDKLKATIVNGSFESGKGAFLYALKNRINQEGEEVVYLNLNKAFYDKYYVITDIVKSLIKYAGKELIDKYCEDLCKIIPNIVPDCPNFHFPSPDEKAERHRLTYRLGNFILEVSLKQPFVIILKGFECMDEPSRNIIYYIMRGQERGNIYFVVSFDNDEVQKEARFDIEHVAGQEGIDEMQIRNLNLYETSEMIATLLGSEKVPMSFADKIFKETAGSPYKIYEIIYSLYHDKSIYVDDRGRWIFDNIDFTKLNLNISIDEMLKNKINKLEPIKREILNIISVFNSAVSLDVLECMTEIKSEDLRLLLEGMISANILSRKMEELGVFLDFNSATLKKHLYESMDDTIRYNYHRKAYQVLESRTSSDISGELIYHMINGGRCDKAIDYLIISSEEAEKKGLLRKAMQLLEKGYETFPDDEVCAKKISICIKLGDLHYKSQEFNEALEHYTIAQCSAVRIGDEMLQADSHIKMVKLFYSMNDVGECIRHSIKAKKLIKNTGYKKGLLELILALSELLIYRRKFNSHMRIIKKVLRRVDEEDKYHHAMLKSVYGRILSKVNRFDEALIYLEESIEILEALGEYEGLIPALNTLGTVYSDYYYDIERATEYFEKNLNICKRYNNLSFTAFSYNNLAEMYREKDKYKESLKYYDKALQVIDKIQNKYLETMTHMNQALANMELEDYKKYMKCMNKAKHILDESKDLGEAFSYFNIYQALFFYNMGCYKESMDYAQKSVDMCISWGMEADAEALYIINLCRARLFDDAEYDKLMIFTTKLLKGRKYKLGRRACHSFAELLVEKVRYEEARKFLALSDEYSINISTNYLETEYEYLTAMTCIGDEREDKLRMISSSDNTIESNELKWKVYKSLGFELYDKGQYPEALKCLIRAMNALRVLVEGVPDQYKVGFLLSHNRHTVKEKLLDITHKVAGREAIYEDGILANDSIDIRKRIDEYFDYKKFKSLINKKNRDSIKSSIDLDKDLMTRFFMDLLDRINCLGQNMLENMNSLIEIAMDLTQAKNAFLAIVDEDDDLRMISSRINSENRAFYKLMMNQARQKNESIIITDVFEYKRKTNDSSIPKDICALFCIPISYSRNFQNFREERRRSKETNKINGYLYLDTDTIINNFTPETHKLCEIICKILHLQIDNYNLNRISGIDKLTNLYTRKYFEMTVQNELSLNFSDGEEFSLIMMDIDRFKTINDRFGHQRGDEILQKIAAIVMDNVRKSDVCARYGGEEFIMLLPRTGSEGAYSLAEKIRKKVENAKLLGHHGIVTISLGIATYPNDSSWMRDLIDKADQALYYSKQNGRNRVTVYNPNMARTVKRVDKLAGIISGNMVEDQRNVETMIEILDLQRKHDAAIDEKLYEFLGKIIEISEADMGCIILLDENKKPLEKLLRKSINKKNSDTISFVDESIQNAIETMSGEYFIDWSGNTPIDSVTGMPDWQSKMLIPIVYGTRLYGILYLVVALKNKEFDANMYNFITRLCEIISPIFMDR